ncbi:hypothetical protein Mp_4g23660 [Marchantia polymorpha subsp. ruderalis]|uniref:Uncharacterized protein n=2 Tax=Marchantia polymorpha TaxID=3197 RepID=A0AAF6BD20_MARPO|nr:hypothetical protein MARPO_0020s0129 [Marchantia polymorpha]BBN09904.1 hypothetical protein Mp_4g23660 [Marchantia polymorpha subsp. ruderalis]|eukprot:PTQ44481.1 hypothetical protein MARPO_0020s0129 [Marchantia polymorpha]
MSSREKCQRTPIHVVLFLDRAGAGQGRAGRVGLGRVGTRRGPWIAERGSGAGQPGLQGRGRESSRSCPAGSLTAVLSHLLRMVEVGVCSLVCMREETRARVTCPSVKGGQRAPNERRQEGSGSGPRARREVAACSVCGRACVRAILPVVCPL